MKQQLLPNILRKIKVKIIILTFIVFNSFYLVTPAAADGIVVFKDVEIENYIKSIAVPLLTAANLDPRAVHIYLVDDPSPNAFVAGGQNIFVFSGLLTFAKSDDEIAGVLAHEISHITEGHLMQGEMLAQKSQILVFASIALGLLAAAADPKQIGNIATVAVLAPGISSFNNSMHFSRSDEMQADKHGMYLLSKTHFNGLGLLNFMERLAKLEGNPNFANDWFSSHPLTSTRITFLKSYLAEEGLNKAPLTVSKEFLRSQAKINAYTMSYQDFVNRYPPTNDINLYGLALAKYAHGDYNGSLNILINLNQKYPSDPYIAEALGDVYFTLNHFEKAFAIYTTAYTYNQDYLINFKLAESAYNLNSQKMLQESLKQLNIALTKNPDFPTAWQIKAMILARFNKPYEAKLALAQKSLILGDKPRAKTYAKEALVGLKKNSQSWLIAQDILNKR